MHSEIEQRELELAHALQARMKRARLLQSLELRSGQGSSVVELTLLRLSISSCGCAAIVRFAMSAL
jgi:hypothetical protein